MSNIRSHVIGTDGHDGYNRMSDHTLLLIRMLKDVAFLAGGMARYIIFPDMVKAEDYDFFLFDEADWEKAQALVLHQGYEVTEENPNGSLKYMTTDTWAPPVQLVYPFKAEGGTSGTPTDVISIFGLTCEQFALVALENSPDLRAYYYEHAKNSAEQKLIVPTNEIDPVLTMGRAIKYARKGFSMRRADILGQFNQWTCLTDEERGAIHERTVGNY
ncbi:hypothetical protein LCGC14_0423530 [marine sediment metagenome]|uniref:Nucleotidyltransferase family protein n=1 Tax=marine sediment metagenome TaxID=412755 RepID=A0A0F9SQ86_9ZZZZ